MTPLGFFAAWYITAWIAAFIVGKCIARGKQSSAGR